jgi:1-acyl-sn-glycerol-3-phosphate acyltransferase
MSPTPDFYPPKLNPFQVRFVQFVAPWIAYFHYRITLEVDDQSVNQLIDLRDRRVLLLPNHPTFQDPIVTFLLSGRVGQYFHYLAAFEQFEGLGPFFQAMGVYSIRRGLADRPSIAQTLNLLTQPDCHLVVFSEGGCSFQNDTVMPYRTGAVQLAFQAMNRLVKQGEPVPDLFVLPVSIKYRYAQPMSAVVNQTLSRLEKALGIPRQAKEYDRLRAIAEKVLTQVEQEYGACKPDGDRSWNDRIATLKACVLQTCEQQLALQSAPNEPDRERVYRILNAVQERAEQEESGEADGTSSWDEAFIRKSMFRILNFDAIYDGYVAADPTPERFLDTLTRLEREVFDIDRPAPKGHRIAQVRIGTPLNLKDYFEAFQKAKSTTVTMATQAVQQTVQENLNRLNQQLNKQQ